MQEEEQRVRDDLTDMKLSELRERAKLAGLLVRPSVMREALIEMLVVVRSLHYRSPLCLPFVLQFRCSARTSESSPS